MHPAALRTWVKQAETDATGLGMRGVARLRHAGASSGTTSSEAARIAELERENRELRRANQILKSAASFFAAELDRPSR
ncbi:transposase [Micromonospora psammae]|uniref:transposase n=1 Tax=Micromonospora sp. CPCC 205556 TaxID=3122398 RepID=UPI003FA52493